MKITKTINPPETVKDYVRLRRGILSHIFGGQISWDEYSVLLHLIIRANPKTGALFTSYKALSEETQGKYSKNRINKILLNLKSSKYVYFTEHRGSGKPFELYINRYPLSEKDVTDGKTKFFLLFTDEDSDSKAELVVNRQNLREQISALSKGKSMNQEPF